MKNVISVLISNILFFLIPLLKIDFFTKIKPVLESVIKIVPHINFYYSICTFTKSALSNARCQRIPDKLYRLTCELKDECCGKNCTFSKYCVH